MIRLLHGDCLAMLKEVEPGSVDLILCDPPYSSGGTHAGDRKASTTAKYTDNDFNGAARLPAFSGDNMDQRSFTAFMRWVCSELRQKTREGGILEMFVDWRNFPAMTDAVQMAGWVWRGVVVWDKGISRNQPGRFRNDCEFVVWCSNGDLPIDWKAAKGTKALPGVYHVPIVAPKQRFHQTRLSAAAVANDRYIPNVACLILSHTVPLLICDGFCLQNEMLCLYLRILPAVL